MPDLKVTRTVVVTDPSGVHARTAVAIAQAVRRGRSQVILYKDQRPVTATDVLQIMTMVADEGETLVLEAIGPDADAVLDSLEPLFAGRFGEEVHESA